MRFILLSAIALMAPPNESPIIAADSEALVQEITNKWQGKIVRDDRNPDHPVVEIVFHCDSQVPDAVIDQLTAFPSLRKLDLVGGQRLTNNGLESVGKLKTLESLSLRNRIVSADGLKHLTRLPALKSLFLWDTPLSEQNMVAIAGYPVLERLELRNVEVFTEGVKSLKKMPRLKEIDAYRISGAFKNADDMKKALPDVKVNFRL